MNIDNLMQAIEHLEKVNDLLWDMEIPGTHLSLVAQDARHSINYHLRLLKDELHSLEIEKLAQWKEINK